MHCFLVCNLVCPTIIGTAACHILTVAHAQPNCWWKIIVPSWYSKHQRMMASCGMVHLQRSSRISGRPLPIVEAAARVAKCPDDLEQHPYMACCGTLKVPPEIAWRMRPKSSFSRFSISRSWVQKWKRWHRINVFWFDTYKDRPPRYILVIEFTNCVRQLSLNLA